MYCLHPQLFPTREVDMNQLRAAVFGSHNGTPTASPPIEHPATQPSLARDDSATTTGAPVDVIEEELEQSANMATDTEDKPATLTGEEVEGLQAAQNQGHSIACPDPSVHQQQEAATKLQEQASKAALYVTTSNQEKIINVRDVNPLGPDGKLSSAGAATSLRYASQTELPAFPSSGSINAAHSHSAANLANTNQKPFEHWKPDASHSAGKAALLAHDNQKPFEHWKPDLSEAGSKAAILAHRGTPKVNIWMPEASDHGNSAAHIAMAKKGLAPKIDYGSTEDGRRRALIAATGAVRTSNSRKRANSTPTPRHSAPSLSGAMAVTGRRKVEEMDANKWDSDAMQAARIQHLHMSRAMYTEHPPVEQFDKEEEAHQAALKASAISMAKKMYDMQQSRIEEAAGLGAARASRIAGTSPLTQDNLKTAAMQQLSLQEAAQRLAEERLAKMKPDDTTALREYYGYKSPPRSPRIRNKLSIRGRKRSNSDGVTMAPPTDRWADSDDEEQSRRIRNQMSLFRDQVQEVDVKKRQKDRAALIAAAEKKVHAQMHDLDEKVFNDTGKMSPAMIEEWENKSRLRLEKKLEEERVERQQSREGGAKSEKIHIGGGKYMDKAEIESIARKRVHPTLLEIGEQAERQRKKDREMAAEKEEKRKEARLEKEKSNEKREEEKRARAEEKNASRVEKEAEKSKRKEEMRLVKEEKRRSKDKDYMRPTAADSHPPDEPAETRAGAIVASEDTIPAVTSIPLSELPPAVAPILPPTDPETPAPPPDGLNAVEPTATDAATATEEPKPKTSSGDESKKTPPSALTSPPGSPTRADGSRGLKGFLNKFKRKSKAAPGEIKGFSGGHRLSRAKEEQDRENTNGNATSATPPIASPTTAPTTAPDTTAKAPGAFGTGMTTTGDADAIHSPSISSVSSLEPDAGLDRTIEEEDAPRGRQRLEAPKTVAAPVHAEGSDLSATQTNTTHEEFEEARDQFDEGLAPPQPAFTSKKSESGSPHRDSKFFEGL
ncbi:hypothetical protein NA57DRAFT_76183 [Rhizodiscina lignyota]|uniref:Eisosome protein 1 n=1 Tax=Rhizodiscina lignyota TaxID=1504668 RepID=A0A9P4M6J6_9PEZI|nr:hypothetical protein NA57DRAFT_76183 [Rhizodiscina lignyota]